MSRGQGRVYLRGTVFWLDYGVGGQRHREPTDATTKREALDILRDRIGDRRQGKVIARPERVMLAEYTKGEDGKQTLSGGLRWLVETQYDLDQRRSKPRIQQAWDHIEDFFPTPTPVTAVTLARIDEYAAHRLAEGASRQTVNNELSAVRRGFNLAIEKGLLAVAPRIKLPRVENARQGFFARGDLAAVILELPTYARPVIEFLDATGWRVREALDLTWDKVDWERRGIRLSAQQTKGKAPRLFPFGAAPDLAAILEAAYAVRNGPYVFQGPRGGRPVAYPTLIRHWRSATKRAACAGRIIHDLRRTAVQAFIDASVDEQTIMELCGMRSRSIFQRYLIVRQDRLDRAVAARFTLNGTTTAQSGQRTEGA